MAYTVVNTSSTSNQAVTCQHAHIEVSITGGLRMVGGDLDDTTEETLYCLDCGNALERVETGEEPSQDDSEEIPF